MAETPRTVTVRLDLGGSEADLKRLVRQMVRVPSAVPLPPGLVRRLVAWVRRVVW